MQQEPPEGETPSPTSFSRSDCDQAAICSHVLRCAGLSWIGNVRIHGVFPADSGIRRFGKRCGKFGGKGRLVCAASSEICGKIRWFAADTSRQHAPSPFPVRLEPGARARRINSSTDRLGRSAGLAQQRRQFSPRRYSEFPEDGVQLGLDRQHTLAQPAGYLGIGEALAYEQRNFAFARGEVAQLA